MAADKAEELGVAPMARIVGQAVSGLSPKWILMTPVQAVQFCLETAGLTMDDVDHVVDRVLRNLLRHAPLGHEVPDRRLKDMIVLADDLNPADLILLQHHGVAGFVTEYGGPTSHMSILARSLGIPGVVGVHHARRYVVDDELLIVDGDDGVVIGGADQKILDQYRERQNRRRDYLAGLQVLKSEAAVTSDGQAIRLHANVELPEECESVHDAGADGVGLYRTEFLFMNRSGYPDEDEHFNTYRQMIDALDNIPITIRTVDIGGDKPLDALTASGSLAANPALGLRAVRLCLREPSLFWPQLRAIIRVSAYGPVRMMIPMLSEIDEVHQVMDIVGTIRNEFSRRGIARIVKYGQFVQEVRAFQHDTAARRLRGEFAKITQEFRLVERVAVVSADDG